MAMQGGELTKFAEDVAIHVQYDVAASPKTSPEAFNPSFACLSLSNGSLNGIKADGVG